MKRSGGDSQTIRIVVTGALEPAISGASVILRSIIAGFEADPRIKCDVVDLSGIRGGGVRSLFRYLRRLLAVFKHGTKSDALLLFTIGSGLPWTLPPFWLIARLTGLKLIVRSTGGVAHLHGGRFTQMFVRFFLRRSSRFVVETRLLHDDAKSAGLPNVFSVPNARDLNNVIRANHEYRGSWVLISRLVPSKGVVEAIEAFRQLPELSLDLIGPSDITRNGVHRGIDFEAVGLPPNVRWLGEREPDAIPSLLAEYDGFVFPSYYPGEGHAGVVIEAMAAGLPVITTDFRSLPELVDSTCGALVPTKDVTALSEALVMIHSDPGLRKRLSDGASKRAQAFDSSELTREFNQLVIDTIRTPCS